MFMALQGYTYLTYRKPLLRVMRGSWGGGRFLMGEVTQYGGPRELGQSLMEVPAGGGPSLMSEAPMYSRIWTHTSPRVVPMLPGLALDVLHCRTLGGAFLP